MTHLRFLAELLTFVYQTWRIHPADLWDESSRLPRVGAAKVAAIVIAYRFDCTPDDIQTAFRWRRFDKRYRKSSVTERHAELLLDAIYVELFEKTERFARELTGSVDPVG